MDYLEIFYVKHCDISQIDFFDVYDKSCVKSNNFTINECCHTNVYKNTFDGMDYFSVPVCDAVEGCNLNGFGFQPHTDIYTYATPSGERVKDVQDMSW
jgi:hypothetical protein